MNKRQRAQVVELLRCAVDCCVTGRMHMLSDYAGTAAWWLASTSETCGIATRAVKDTAPRGKKRDAGDAATFVCVCLEAAQRVEEGTWP